MKKQIHSLAVTSLAVSSALLGMTATVQAAGFQLAETSATGLGRAFAGEAAMADNAATQFRNPAMMTYLNGTQMTAGAILVMPNIDVEGYSVLVDMSGQPIAPPVATTAKDIAGDAVIPNFFMTHQLNDQWFVGLALGTNFGMATEFDDEFLGTQFGNEASITAIEINPNVAYRVNDNFSVGAGVRMILGEGSIGAKSSADIDLPIGAVIPGTPGTIPVAKGTTLKYMKGDDISWGWQLGAAWQLDANNRIGVNYRSAVDQTLEGEAHGFAFNPLDPSMKLDGSMDLSLPATAEIASFHQVTPQLALHASVNWTGWSSFDKLEAYIPSLREPTQLVKQENWEDSYRFALGATYHLDAKSTLRAGVAYDMSAVSDANRTITIPEMDRVWLSAGYGYQFSEQFDMDFGVTYIIADESPVVEPRPGIASDNSAALFGGAFMGNTSGNIILVGVQASYKF
ncbi:outer membrane protein transport protein [Shewanella sp. NIFS-20-20]|uniref:outer membrane protein transport protein n=1 Tax=Shewanella sp. NIFS-20-20 TaxID=2853806 RepID=UPI001C48C48A|nr:outer membrane protein transport protein [Shewanella sp. NIFS-20-20]MBV7315739.1 outer membrane protein transport protein [Shewanella sp. NIFS-20-20]